MNCCKLGNGGLVCERLRKSDEGRWRRKAVQQWLAILDDWSRSKTHKCCCLEVWDPEIVGGKSDLFFFCHTAWKCSNFVSHPPLKKIQATGKYPSCVWLPNHFLLKSSNGMKEKMRDLSDGAWILYSRAVALIKGRRSVWTSGYAGQKVGKGKKKLNFCVAWIWSVVASIKAHNSSERWRGKCCISNHPPLACVCLSMHV